MSKRTVFTELSVCETLIMRQIWAYEGDIPVQTLIVKLNEEYGKNYARTTVVTLRKVIQDDADFWFDGKPSALLASLLEDRKLSKEEADKIKELIKNA